MSRSASARLRAVLAAGAFLAAAAPAAHAAPTQLSDAQDPTVVAAHDGTVMWSERNPQTGQYRLVKSVDGGPKSVVEGVAEYREPFDLDLGTNRGGALYAVYTRDGFIHRLPVAGGPERRLTYISLGGTNHSPTIHNGRIAFIHGERRRDSLRYTDSTSRKPRALRTGVLNEVELGPKHVAYTESRSNGARTLVRIRNLRTGRDAVVYQARSGGANTASVTRPTATADGTAFVWARTNLGSGEGNRVVRYTLRGGRLAYAQGNPRYATSAWAGDQLGLAFSTALDPRSNAGCQDAGVNYCGVGVTGPLQFTAQPRLSAADPSRRTPSLTGSAARRPPAARRPAWRAARSSSSSGISTKRALVQRRVRDDEPLGAMRARRRAAGRRRRSGAGRGDVAGPRRACGPARARRPCTRPAAPRARARSRSRMHALRNAGWSSTTPTGSVS